MGDNVIVIEKSRNTKTGPISCTYAPDISCIDLCPVKEFCYGNFGYCRMIKKRIKDASGTPGEIAQEEASGINELSGKRPLRVHIVGDAKTAGAANILGDAMVKYSEEHEQSSWTYTHGWRYIHEDEWNGANVVASCETVEHIREARDQGYAGSIIVPEYRDTKPFFFNGELIAPCPAVLSEKETTCFDCLLCADTDYLKRSKMSVGFTPHGTRERKLREYLRMCLTEEGD
jgi:hypothetical protein